MIYITRLLSNTKFLIALFFITFICVIVTIQTFTDTGLLPLNTNWTIISPAELGTEVNSEGEKVKFIVNGNDTLLLKDFLNSDPFMPVGDFIATKAKWRDEGSIFSLSIMDVATLLSGNPAVVDDNEYHKTLNYQRRHGFMGPIINGGKRGWTRGLKYIISAI